VLRVTKVSRALLLSFTLRHSNLLCIIGAAWSTIKNTLFLESLFKRLFNIVHRASESLFSIVHRASESLFNIVHRASESLFNIVHRASESLFNIVPRASESLFNIVHRATESRSKLPDNFCIVQNASFKRSSVHSWNRPFNLCFLKKKI
jgi:hypothetical protein